MKDIYEIYWWLDDHPFFQGREGFSRFDECLDFDIVKVNPANESIEDDETLNTAVRFWFECGKWVYPSPGPDEGSPSHDPDLNCRGATYEEGLTALYEKVKEIYGDYEDESGDHVWMEIDINDTNWNLLRIKASEANQDIREFIIHLIKQDLEKLDGKKSIKNNPKNLQPNSEES